ncbi:MAG: histidinol-phosphatase [Proteobacteria bacterium]|nr:histidinol-phosphatase [Pseudomonadota bacterium]
MPDFDPTLFASLARFSSTLADASGAVIRRYYRQPIPVDIKADESPVTIADREAEAVLRRLIEEAYPDHGIIGEELDNIREDAEFVWVLDPIDGTRSFITGKPLFGTLIALCHQQTPVIGIIDQPISGERWLGRTGHPTLLGTQPVTTRPCAELAHAALYTTGHEWYGAAHLTAFKELEGRVRMTQYSADCYAFALLATGFVDLVCECSMHNHDIAALVPVITGAGGVMTDWQGKNLDLNSRGCVLAAGDRTLHQKALAILHE